MSLFLTTPLQPAQPKTFYDFALAEDKAGAARLLSGLTAPAIELAVVKAGFRMISRHHGKPELIKYAVDQIGKIAPRECGNSL